MKNLFLSFCLVILSLASPVWSETIDELVERNGKYYLKYSDGGFSGKVVGKIQGTLKDGLWEGKYTEYYSNGQLEWKGHYEDGKKDGLWELYDLWGRIKKENYVYGVKID